MNNRKMQVHILPFMTLSNIKQYGSAKDAYKRVLERDPKHAKVLQQLGWLHHQQSNDYQNQEQAIEYLEQSVASGRTVNMSFTCCTNTH